MKFTITAPLPTFILLIYPQGKTPVVYVAFLNVIYSLKASGYYKYRRFYHSKFCVLLSLAVRSENGDSSRSVGSHKCHCQVKLLQNTGTLLTAQWDVRSGGGASGAAVKFVAKRNFKGKKKLYQLETYLSLSQMERNSVNN